MSRRSKHKAHLHKQREQSRQAQVQHQQKIERQTREKEQHKKSKTRIAVIAGAVAVVVVAAIVFFAVNSAKAPGPVDDFAKCLSEKGVVMYGADFCKYTQGQRAMFGKSFKYIDYREYTKGPNIKITPTWIIGGKKYEKAQDFDRLAYLSGCKLR